MTPENENNELATPRLEVYLSNSVLVAEDGTEQNFQEGKLSEAAKERQKKIRKAFSDGFLVKIFEECKSPNVNLEPISKDLETLFSSLVESVTSENGRAILGLTILQLVIKAIEPAQSIRLHKGGGGGNNFSWSEGLPMRSIDNTYLTPLLRKYDLLRLNNDGVFMTRSLSENYPYSKLYKAAIRGARREWLEVVDLIELGKIDPLISLKHIVTMLFNQNEGFKQLAEETLVIIESVNQKITSLKTATDFVLKFVDDSTYSARIFEIAMHSFYQALEDLHAFDGFLKPLSQMRSANKKHGNVGDIEITLQKEGLEILEAWDAKYGQPYLRDELEELEDKLRFHLETKLVGFVVNTEPNKKEEVTERASQIEGDFSVEVIIDSFENWVVGNAKRVSVDETVLAQNWLTALAESICQKRRERAPIDEPCYSWVLELKQHSEEWLGKL